MPHAETKHVVALMLENRSFDHLFGFLDHPKKFEGLHGLGFTNPDNNGVEIPATPDATFEVPHDPSHRHFSVMYQLTETDPSGTLRGNPGPPASPTFSRLTRICH